VRTGANSDRSINLRTYLDKELPYAAATGASVYLVNIDSGKRYGAGKQLGDRFEARNVPPGQYRVATEGSGYQNYTDEGAEPITVTDGDTSYGLFYEAIPTGETAVVRLEFRDKTPVGRLDPYFDLNSHVTISLSDANGLVRKFDVEGDEEVLLTQVPRENGKLTIEIEGIRFTAAIKSNERLVIPLPNSAPFIKKIHIFDEKGNEISPKNVKGNQVLRVEVDAIDPDGDRLSYHWRTEQPQLEEGKMWVKGKSQVQWRLPQLQGYLSLPLLVGDGKGAYIYVNISVQCDG
jgi:hypothetical protein